MKNLLILIHLVSQILERLRLKNVLQYLNQRSCYSSLLMMEQAQISTILSGIHAFYEPEELVGKTLIAITNLPPRAMMGIESCGMLLSAIHEEEGKEKLHLLMVDNHIPAGAKLY